MTTTRFRDDLAEDTALEVVLTLTSPGMAEVRRRLDGVYTAEFQKLRGTDKDHWDRQQGRLDGIESVKACLDLWLLQARSLTHEETGKG